VHGIDIDPSACRATELSLTLLYYALTGQFPKKLNIHNEEAIKYFGGHAELAGAFGAVIANPPFVKWDHLQPEMRLRVSGLVKELSKGRPDLFLAFLQVGLGLLREGGYLLFVLPHSFLLARNAGGLRRRIAESCWVHVLADLSEIPVFEGIGSYVVLLIVQRRALCAEPEPTAIVVRCREYVGRALLAAVRRRTERTDFYEVFEVDQEVFRSDPWVVLSRQQVSLRRRLKRYIQLGDIAAVRQGMVTGCDPVFVHRAEDVPAQERRVWLSFLADRDLGRYRVPRVSSRRVFYPFDGPSPLSEQVLKEKYPETYQYLRSNRDQLASRGPVKAGRVEWWRPDQPRPAKNLLRPKLVTPHLVLKPRFAIDESGRFAVSRSPLVLCHSGVDDLVLLKYLLAVLNSTVGYWQITTLSHKYRSGYAMLEVKTLRDTRVPSPSEIEPRTMMRIQRLVDKLIANSTDAQVNEELDQIIATVYELTKAERSEVGLEQ